jgi:hypothetical protein
MEEPGARQVNTIPPRLILGEDRRQQPGSKGGGR